MRVAAFTLYLEFHIQNPGTTALFRHDNIPEIGGLKVRMAIDAGELECREGDY
jgi:hypothetical protein